MSLWREKLMAEETALKSKIMVYGARNQVNTNTAPSEKELLILVKKGDREAYQVIVKRYMQTAYFIVLGYVNNHQDALDVSQEAFIKAFRKIKNYELSKA